FSVSHFITVVGLLNGLVALSGSALSSFAVDHDPLATGQDLARRNNCPESPVLDMVRCLQELPVETLVQADSGLQEMRLAAQGFVAGLTSLLGASPAVDGSDDQRSLPGFLERSPLEALKLGQFPDIPLLTGVTAAETASALSGVWCRAVELMRQASNSSIFLLSNSDSFRNGYCTY
ncbi:unnamed protein product, partial [Timema podura]|nr:unnamed protein product [Timema podura]